MDTAHCAVWPAGCSRRLIGLAVGVVVLGLCFSSPLLGLVRFALKNDLFSHILLVPFLSMYLVWLRRDALNFESSPKPISAILPFVLGLGLLAGYWQAVQSGWQPTQADYLAVMVVAMLWLFFGNCRLFLGTATLRAVAFPLVFLLFMAPFPTVLRDWIETFLQYASAEAAYALIYLAGLPVLRQGLEFQLPGMSMQVAQECSGIRSSLVLFMTGLIAGHLLLRTSWKRGLLALAVIPLGILRNGFRIFALAQLCVHISPDMIRSDLHRRGGPVFFVLSLVPFFLLLWVLRRSEARKSAPNGAQRG